MGWIPNKEEILNEVKNYEDLTFFKKSKNALATFATVVSALSILLMRGQENYFMSAAFYETAFCLLLAVFIFLNHRWAMVLFCGIYVLARGVTIASAIMIGILFPFSHIIFGVWATILTYSAYKVATEMMKTKDKRATNT